MFKHFSHNLNHFWKRNRPLLDFNHKITGIEITSSSVKILTLCKTKNQIKQLYSKTFGLSDYEINGPHLENVKQILRNNFSQSGLFDKNQVILVLPDLKVIYKKTEELADDYINDNQIIKVRDQAHSKDNGVTLLFRDEAIVDYLQLIKELNLHVSAICRGLPEWVYSYLALHSDLLDQNVMLALVDSAKIVVIEIVDGKCSDISSFSNTINKKDRNVKKLELENLLKYIDTNGRFGNRKLDYILCQDDWSGEIGTNQTSNSDLSLDKSFMFLAGSIICQFFPHFSSFNLLPPPLLQSFGLWKKQFMAIRIGALVNLFILLFSLALYAISNITGYQLKKWQTSLFAEQQNIQMIESLKNKKTELLDTQNQTKTILARKSRVGRILYEISQTIPANSWLTELSYSKEVTKKNAGPLKSGKVVLGGYANNEDDTILFIKQLQYNPFFTTVILESYEQPQERDFVKKDLNKPLRYFQIGLIVK